MRRPLSFGYKGAHTASTWACTKLQRSPYRTQKGKSDQSIKNATVSPTQDQTLLVGLPEGIRTTVVNSDTQLTQTPTRLNDSRSQRVVWLLEELGLDYEIAIFHRDKTTMFAPPELEKVHPLGKAPAVGITFPGRGKETILVESGFIAQYLCEHFSTGSTLVPPRYPSGEQQGKQQGGESEAWMRYQHLMHYVEGSLMPPLLVALILTVMKGPRIPLILRPIVSFVADKLYAAFVKPNVTKHMAFLEGLLASAPGGGPYLCGEHLTAADIFVSFPLEIAPERIKGLKGRKANLFSEYPGVTAYIERLWGAEGYKRAREKPEKLENGLRSV